MACLCPIRIINPHYRKLAEETKTNIYSYSNLDDFAFDVPCGKCLNCQKSRSTMWRVRLLNEYEFSDIWTKENSHFVTFTLSDDYINEDVSVLVRRFLERVRRKYKRSLRHWFVTEYGETTERLHLHGLIFGLPFSRHELDKLWKYGFVSSKPLTYGRIIYITKYITKFVDDYVVSPERLQRVFCSKGIGRSYVDSPTTATHVLGSPSPFIYSGSKPVAMPRYYRNKLFTEDELLFMKQLYFGNQSDDVILDGPYYIGKRRIDDYTVYLSECQSIKEKYYNLYIKPRYGKKSYLSTSEY